MNAPLRSSLNADYPILPSDRIAYLKIIDDQRERDLEDVPADVRSELTFVMVETIEEVLKEVMDIDLPGPMLSYPANHCAPVHNL